jgi:hypothetical protein
LYDTKRHFFWKTQGGKGQRVFLWLVTSFLWRWLFCLGLEHCLQLEHPYVLVEEEQEQKPPLSHSTTPPPPPQRGMNQHTKNTTKRDDQHTKNKHPTYPPTITPHTPHTQQGLAYLPPTALSLTHPPNSTIIPTTIKNQREKKNKKSFNSKKTNQKKQRLNLRGS